MIAVYVGLNPPEQSYFDKTIPKIWAAPYLGITGGTSLRCVVAVPGWAVFSSRPFATVLVVHKTLTPL